MTEEMIVYLPFHPATGKVDRLMLDRDLRDLEECRGFKLVEGWEFRPFKIIPA